MAENSLPRDAEPKHINVDKLTGITLGKKQTPLQKPTETEFCWKNLKSIDGLVVTNENIQTNGTSQRA